MSSLKQRIVRTWQNHRNFLIASLVGLAVFSGLQMATLTKWSVWHDEGFTAMLIEYNTDDMLQRAALDVHPPMYYLMLKGWATMFGSSLFSLRLFSVIGMAGVFILSLWLVRRLAGSKAAWRALPIFVIAPALLRYGQEMRMYSWVAVFCLLATHILLSIIKIRFTDKLPVPKKLWLAYVLTLSLIVYTHYFAALLFVVHWVVFYVALRGDGRLRLQSFIKKLFTKEKWWLAAYVTVGLTFVPWLPSFWEQFSAVKSGFWIGPVTASSFLSTISGFLIFHPEWASWRLDNWYALVMVLAAVIMAYFAYIIVKSPQLSRVAKTLLLGYWTIPMVILFVLSLPPLTSYYYDRYFVTFAPLFYIFLAVGLTTMWDKLPRAKLHWASAVTVFFVACLAFGNFQAQVHGNNFGHTADDNFTMNSLAAGIRGQWHPGDVVITDGVWPYFDTRFYLSDLTQARMYSPVQPSSHGNTSLVYNREDIMVYDLASLYSRSGRIWLVTETKTDPGSLAPINWQAQSTVFNEGYARVNLYTVK